jgi:excisionase family DNA binding protein
MPVSIRSLGDDLLSAKQVASILQIQLCTVYELARSGVLPSIRIGSRIVRFRSSSIASWIAQRELGGHDVK